MPRIRKCLCAEQVPTQAPPPPGVPTGAVCYFPSASPPTGFLECNGALVSRTTYADLFAVIGTAYGLGDGSTTFAIPDLRVVNTQPAEAERDDEVQHAVTDGTNGTPRTAVETRPRNIAMLACIKI